MSFINGMAIEIKYYEILNTCIVILAKASNLSTELNISYFIYKCTDFLFYYYKIKYTVSLKNTTVLGVETILKYIITQK